MRGPRPFDPYIDPMELSTGPYKLAGASRFDQIQQLELLKTVAHPPAYRKIITGLHKLMAGEPEAPGPAIIAQAVLNAVTSSNPPVRHALPLDSKMAVAARWLLGARLFAWAIRRQMKL